MPNERKAEYLEQIDLIREGAIRLLNTDPGTTTTVTSEIYQEALRIAHDVWDGVIMEPCLADLEEMEEEEDNEDWKNN